MKIFISIASYQDPLTLTTMQSALNNCKYYNDITIGCLDQTIDVLTYEDLPENIKYKSVHPQESKGACWARKKIQTELFDDEDIFMQIDSHMIFEDNWDEKILKQYDTSFQWTEKPIITCYPPGFDVLKTDERKYINQHGIIEDDFKYIYKLTHPKEEITHVMRSLNWFTMDPNLLGVGNFFTQEASSKPKGYYLGYGLAGGYIFTSGKWVSEVPYDDRIYFSGEEQTLALRSFTRGWDIIHGPEIPLYHWYNTGDMELKRKTHWGADADPELQAKNQEHIKQAALLVDRILAGKEKGIYGIGEERTLQDFYKRSGIDYENRVVHPETAMFWKQKPLPMMEESFE